VLSTLKTAGDTESGAEQANLPREYEPQSLADIEREHILRTLNSTNWNKSRAAASNDRRSTAKSGGTN